MANDKRFVAKNGLQAQSTLYVSPDGSQNILVSMLDTDVLSINGAIDGTTFSGTSFTGGSFSGSTYTSTVATGTAPLTVASTTRVANLNVASAGLADAWTTARTLSLTGAVTGSVAIDGSGDVSLSTIATNDPTLTLSGDASGSATFTNLGDATLSVTIANDSHTHAFDNLTNKTSGTGNYSTTGNLESGRASGGVALTINDGQGDANVTFNHANGTAEQAGNVGRIEVNTDTTTSAYMAFHVANNASAGAVTPAEIFRVVPTGVEVTSGTYTGNGSGLTSVDAATAQQWATARTLSLTGAVTGSVSIDGSGNVSLATTATSDPTLTLSGDASGTATFTNLGNATLTVSVSQAGNADTLDSLNSTQFLRSDADDTTSGTLTVNGSGGIDAQRGTTGGYGTTAGTGTDWGANIWGMGSAYNSSGSGTSFVVGDHYGLVWLRDTEAAVTSTIVDEGMYVYRAGTKLAGIGRSGHWFSGEVRATGDVTSFYSDERLKNFHGKIDSALDKVSALNGYYYTENELAKSLGYNNDKMQLGVSAQEVQKVFPEAVATAAISYKDGVDDEYLTVKYEKLVPALIEAVKEQQVQIDELTAKVNALLAAGSK